MSLGIPTLFRVSAWLLLGVVVYLVYGMSHSQLSSDLLEEQTHQFQTATCHTI
jgi:hypothetical protein